MRIELFWAKTSSYKDKPDAFHPLICHLIDVAVAADGIWNEVLPDVMKKQLAKPFGLENDLEKAGKLIAFLAGLHDLGKCSPPFALRGKNEKGGQTARLLALYAETECNCDNFDTASDAPHGFVTAVELPPILCEMFKIPRKLAESVAQIIGGHHGTFATTGKLNELSNENSVGNEAWKQSRRALVENLARIFGVEGDFSELQDEKIDNATAMVLAGLTSTADWIGSNQDYFKCEVEDSTKTFTVDAQEYLEKSRKITDEALRKLGWKRWVRETREKKFDELFPSISNPRHLQIEAQKIAQEIDSIGIAILESPMGEGKTEAAMFLADAFNARLGTRGIYFALPTQATSNQMFGRVKEFLSKRFEGENLNIQLMLLHGHSSVSAEFAEKIAEFKNICEIYDDAENRISSVAAAEWFTYKKRGLLVPFGVGTIDQMLLSVLQTKHFFVRLFGLAHKTVIIDEVHAYDAYMSTLLERQLEWLAALGSPVVMLSATLPRKKRDALIKAYLKGLKKAADRDSDDSNSLEKRGDADSYPRISYAFASMPDKTFKIRRLETSTQNVKSLNLEWKNEKDFVAELTEKLVEKGGCVAIICNTVDKSQTLYEELAKCEFFRGTASDGLPKLDLLHARFRFIDRDEREKRCLKRFGKPDENGKSLHRPDCSVLIATQIIEQSLDLDFDLMISELAPADLLLQRAGRLQRHKRSDRNLYKDFPTLWLLKSPTDENGDLFLTNDDMPDFGKSGIVYDKHILLRTWLKLRHEEKIEIPADIENLIEDVYDNYRVFENLSEREKLLWQKTLEDYQTSCESEEDQAASRYIKRPHYSGHIGGISAIPKEEDAPELHPHHQAQTRLVEPTANVVCVWEKEGKIFADESFRTEISLDEKPNKDTEKQLLFNSLAVSSKSVVFHIFGEETPKGWEKSALLKRHRVLKFGADRKCRKFGYIFHLDQNLGLKIYKEENDVHI